MSKQGQRPPLVIAADGGGLRGFVSLFYAIELERRAGVALTDAASMMVGSSAGGLWTLGLASGKTPDYMLRVFRERGEEIFPHMRFWRVRTLAEPKHDPRGLESVLRDEFGDRRMGEAVLPVMVTAYDAKARITNHLSSWRTPSVLMRDAARDTAAAPVFLPSRDFNIDGGVPCNNPVMRAYAEARRMFGSEPSVLSFGTGWADEPLADAVLRGGVWSWIPHLIETFMDAMSEEAHAQAEILIERYFRFNPRLPRGFAHMDDSRPQFFRGLEAACREDLAHMDGGLIERCIDMLPASKRDLSPDRKDIIQ